MGLEGPHWYANQLPPQKNAVAALSANTHGIPLLEQRQPKLSSSPGHSGLPGGLVARVTRSTEPLMCRSKREERVCVRCCCASSGVLSLAGACSGGRSSSENAQLQTVPQTCCVLPRVLDNEMVVIVPTVRLRKVTDNQLTSTSAASAVKPRAQTSGALPLRTSSPPWCLELVTP